MPPPCESTVHLIQRHQHWMPSSYFLTPVPDRLTTSISGIHSRGREVSEAKDSEHSCRLHAKSGHSSDTIKKFVNYHPRPYRG
ncbi:hypothetical protein ACOSP7_025673 [Xanthoceras sorbifolium]